MGLVGVGRIGAFHAASLKDLDIVEQVVVSDADPARARAVAKELDREAVPDVEYDGWYVLEQDTILAGPPQVGPHAPIADVRASTEHLFAIAGALS